MNKQKNRFDFGFSSEDIILLGEIKEYAKREHERVIYEGGLNENE